MKKVFSGCLVDEVVRKLNSGLFLGNFYGHLLRFLISDWALLRNSDRLQTPAGLETATVSESVLNAHVTELELLF